MFTKESKPSSGANTIIGQSVEVEGNFKGNGDVLIEGTLTGTLKTTGNLKIGSGAKIKADVEAKNIFTSGEINGSQIIAHEKLELSQTAKIHGNISAATISMESGAIINGKINMSHDHQAEIQASPIADKKDKRNSKA